MSDEYIDDADEWRAARLAQRDEVAGETAQNEAERELLQKYRGWSESGESLATTNAGVFVSYPEWNRREAERAALSSQLELLTEENEELEKQVGASESRFESELERLTTDALSIADSLTPEEAEYLRMRLPPPYADGTPTRYSVMNDKLYAIELAGIARRAGLSSDSGTGGEKE